MARKRTEPPPYWIEGIEELCEDCGHRYAYAVEVRCFDCDKPLCPFCVITFETESVCKVCRAERER